jgi:hypothetical protein
VEYAFRSVDKDPSAILPEELRGTLVDRIVQDQISSGHPAGALVVAPLLEAVGVLHADPRLVVMSDDPALGEFRAEFRGMLGTIEVVPDEGADTVPGFMGATTIIGSDRLFERVEEDLERVDTRELLSARLVDVFLGDWDRHRDQWRWARFGESRDSLWRPIPRDRDQAFVRLDGALLTLARQYFPQLVNFGDEYPPPLGITWNGRELDRRFLVELEWPAWDTVARSLTAQLTDEAIERAVAQLPETYLRIDGERMRRALLARRDALPAFARRFYTMLAADVDIHTTDAPEVAHIRRISDRELEVDVVARSADGAIIPVFRRRFLSDETEEVRVFMHGGDDSVRVTGQADPGITVRAIGGGDDDTFADLSLAGGAHFYDASDDNTFDRTNGVRIDEREYRYLGPPYPPSQPPRDWGRQYRLPLWMLLAPDIGALIGIGVERYSYGFRTWPWASQVRLRAAIGTSARTYKAEIDARLNRENTASHWTLSARVSGLEVLRFHGFGNETAHDSADSFFEVDQTQVTIGGRRVWAIGAKSTVALGPEIRYTHTDTGDDRLIGVLDPYGTGSFGEMGVHANVLLDGRNRTRAATRGAVLDLGSAVYPAVWDAASTFGEVNGSAATYLTAPTPLRPTLALRVGGRKLWGRYPFSDAAYIGDDATVRLGFKQRYAGDAEVHANVELRLHLVRSVLVLPADFGVFGLYDTGRVWYSGESSDRWHRAAGAGISIAFLQPENTLSLAVTRAEGRTGIYVNAGFAF